MLFYSAVIKDSNNTIINSTLIITLVLTIKDLEKVKEVLKDAGFDNTKWMELGGKLGLHNNTLKTISVDERGDTDSCFRECLVKWLQQVDDVGEPSLTSLADALKKTKDSKVPAKYISECIAKTISIPSLCIIMTTLYNVHCRLNYMNL